MTKSYVVSGGKIVDNVLLKEDKYWANKLGVVLQPAVTINNITYRGDIDGNDIFRAVCAGFSQMPEICRGNNVEEVVNADTKQQFRYARNRMMRFYHIIGAVVLVLILNFAALYIYRRY